MDEYTANLEFMKSGICDIDVIATADIERGIPQPPLSAGEKKAHCRRLIEILLQR